MAKHFHTLVIGGGCLGAASAISLARRFPVGDNRVGLIERKVLGAGFSSRHSGIVRSANASPMAARLAQRSTALWKNLPDVWRVAVTYERSDALWIGRGADSGSWHRLSASLREAGIQLESVDLNTANDLTGRCLRFDPDDVCFFEPEALQLEPGEILQALRSAVEINGVELHEHTRVVGFELNEKGHIGVVKTDRGPVGCDFVVNAAGGWSKGLLEPLGRHIPIALEPVYATNWLVSSRALPGSMPIIADYVNRAYFRRWHGSILHMHRPRQRDAVSIAASFSRSHKNPDGADIIFDAANSALSKDQLAGYAHLVQQRFSRIDTPIPVGGYASFFDITPDLNFILGFDTEIGNLIHCLGAGQALKYAPVFGELLAELIVDGRIRDTELNLAEFSIDRFPNDHPALFGRPDLIAESTGL